MRRRPAFTLVEVLVTVAVLLIGLLVIATSYSLSLREATETRERQLALLMADNLLERIQDHVYGQEQPVEWGTTAQPVWEEVPVVVDGRKVETRYQYYVEVAPDGNGSFFGGGERPYDRLRLHVKWREPLGQTDWKDAELSFDTTVWRQYDTLLEK